MATVAVAALAAFVTGSTQAARAARTADGAGPAAVTGLRIPGELDAVAAVSPSSAWAVGYIPNPKQGKPDPLLIVHWDGVRWKRVTVPQVSYGQLFGVAAVSKNDAWAVGANEFPAPRAPFAALVLHWDGKTWRPVPGLLSFPGIPEAVSATAKDVWVAVGADHDKLLHYAGGRWSVVPAAKPATGTLPLALATTGAGSGWLGGAVEPVNSVYYSAFILRWNGAAWRHVSLPVGDPVSQVNGIASLPGGSALAVGMQAADPFNVDTWVPLSLRWNGKAWHQVPVTVPGAIQLYGIARIPGGTAWAVGNTTAFDTGAVVLRWTGTAWRQAASPASASTDDLYAVTATSAANAWAVGAVFPAPSYSKPYTVILHWNGAAWR